MIEMATQTETEFVWARRFRENVTRILDSRPRGARSRLAEQLGVDLSYVTITLSSDSDRIGSDTIEKWAAALGVDPADLVKIPESGA